MRYALNNCKYTETYQPRHQYTFTGPCVVTGKECSVTVNGEDLYRYHQHGEHLQKVFPYLKDWEREFLMSGCSEEGWEQLFGSDDDEEGEINDHQEDECNTTTGSEGIH